MRENKKFLNQPSTTAITTRFTVNDKRTNIFKILQQV